MHPSLCSFRHKDLGLKHRRYQLQVVAIGNGELGREAQLTGSVITGQFLRLTEFHKNYIELSRYNTEGFREPMKICVLLSQIVSGNIKIRDLMYILILEY